MNIYTFILLNLVFWVCNNLPRKIVNFDATSSVLSYIFHLIYFLLFSFFVLIAFAKDKNIFSKNLFDKELSIVKRFEIKKCLILFLLQIVFDCAVCLLSSISVLWKYFSIDILIPLYWFIIYFICVGMQHLKKDTIKIFIFEICFVFGLTICSLFITPILFADYIALLDKYQNNSPILLEVMTNAEFIYSLKILVIDTLIGISLLITNRVLSTDKNKIESCTFTKISLRMIIVGVVLYLCIFLKAIYPDQILLGWENDHTVLNSYKIFNSFNVERDDITIYRFSGQTNTATPCYRKANIMIAIDEITLPSFTSRYSGILYPYCIRDHSLKENFLTEDISTTQTKISIYNSQVICFYENNKPRIIKITDIQNCEENDILIDICKAVLSEGNIYIFEYTVDYLNRYAPDFIVDYIERYANGDFTESESLWMQANHYRNTYIINIAKQYN